MADMRTNLRAPQAIPDMSGTGGLSPCRREPAPTGLERFGFGGEDEPPSCRSLIL
ncbi:hypothetical protein [Nocardia transvalensis]|uniref:hypothetical protein n=1 Tax=Nocardia transvalensis TaxID=37333 RepID=UPI001893BB39|nr:hypothetical protein [Nocardia transvalensis]MBF6330278.1 hypothetical protein [Nocardia transvalensis]